MWSSLWRLKCETNAKQMRWIELDKGRKEYLQRVSILVVLISLYLVKTKLNIFASTYWDGLNLSLFSGSSLFHDAATQVIQHSTHELYRSCLSTTPTNPNPKPEWKMACSVLHSEIITCNTRKVRAVPLRPFLTKWMASICLCPSAKYTHFFMNTQLLSRS